MKFISKTVVWMGVAGGWAAVAIFCAGAWFDHAVMARTAPEINQPIATDFCFVAKSYFLFSGKRFVMQADLIYGLDSHFMKSSQCPDLFMMFELTPKAKEEMGSLQRSGRIGGLTFPVTFVGSIAEDPVWFRYATYTTGPYGHARPTIEVEEFVGGETKR